ncbi:MAG: hypothetical protein M3014_10525 [Chloroflexota bacterium]|nr:hypothetical protein [Chloroflexota bacterium]
MFAKFAREKSVALYHMELAGESADGLEVRALKAPRFETRLRHIGLHFTDEITEADVVVATGLLTERSLTCVLDDLGRIPDSATLVAVGDKAVGHGALKAGGIGREITLPGVSFYTLSHYAHVQVSVPGNPPTPQAILAGIETALKQATQPRGAIRFEDEEV